jgi:N-acyl-D-amino-acid deacylase
MLVSLAALALLLPSPAPAPVYDLVIRDARIADGTGNPLYTGDVAVHRGRIAKVGSFEGKGKEEVSGKGKVLAPGFLDVHTHSENLAEVPKAENYLRMGVTTIVTGNCGGSALAPREFFAKVGKTKVSPNVATLIGHNTVRRKAMGGDFDRAPTPKELAEMRALVDAAMRQGAVGLSTGLIYMPGTFSKTDEIQALAKVSAEHGGIYVSHMRSEGLQLLEAIEELIAIARFAGCRAQISHIKASGNASWGKSAQALELVEKAREDGVDVTQDQYMYTASSTSLNQTIPDWAKEGGSEAFKKRLADPGQKARMVADMKQNLERNGRKDYTYAVIASCRSDKSLNGKNVPQAAKIKRGSDDLDAQIETILEIEKAGGASGVFHGMSEDDVRRYLEHPNTMIASDGGPREINETVPHPRSYGNNARLLERYVRQQKLLRLEEAVRKMTSLPAQTFRIADRGQVREGLAADLVLFDPAAVKENCTFTDPHRYATGFALVLVNGVPVVRNDTHTGARPGKALRLKNRVVRADR